MTEIREEYIEAARELLRKRKANADKRQAEAHATYNKKRVASGLPPVEQKGYDHRDRFYEKKKAEKMASPEYLASVKAREKKSFDFMMRLAKDLQDRGDRIAKRKELAKENAKARTARKYAKKKIQKALFLKPKKLKEFVPVVIKFRYAKTPKVKSAKEPRIRPVKAIKTSKQRIVREIMAKRPKQLIKVPAVHLRFIPKKLIKKLLPKAIKPKNIRVRPVQVPKPPKLRKDKLDRVQRILHTQVIKVRDIDLSKTLKVMLDSKTAIYVKPGTDVEALKLKFENRNKVKSRRWM